VTTQVKTDLGSVVEEFERRVGSSSGRCAIRACGETPALTYGELDRWANAIAARLLAERGDEAEPVALLIASPAHMLAAALGALKAGKFYVPINPFHPKPRVDALLAEVGAAVVLGDAAGADVADVVRVEDVVADTSARRPGLRFDAERVAYVIYTSGSTGRPRGVAVTRGNMLHNVARHNPLGVGQADTVTLLSADGFVTSVSNPYVTLLRGGTLAPYSFKDSGVDGMLDWLGASNVTVFYGFPSFLRQLAALTPPGVAYPGLRLAYLGGETVLPADLAAARRLFPKATLSTGLNSTETGLTCLHLVAPTAPIPDPVPVGRPVAGVEVALAGDEDEIEIRSRNVRPRYWRDGVLDDPTTLDGDGTYAFRTGDRGRLGESGEVYHLGRLDGMVKVRGFRVEVTEVEAAIAALDGVTDVAVVATGEELTAYVVGGGLTPATVRGGVAAALPAAMIPARVVTLDALPRMDNGKIDRRALAAAAPATQPAATPAPDASGVEGRIAAIWRAVLGTDSVGTDDDFFALGGTSISAVTTIARIRAELGVQVPLAALFEAPTVGALAQAVLRLKPAVAPAAQVEVRLARAADWAAAAPLAGIDTDAWLAERARSHARYPWLVAVEGESVVGFAQARAWHPDPAYAAVAEVLAHAESDGVRNALYARLVELLDAQGFRAAVSLREVPGFEPSGAVLDTGIWVRANPAPPRALTAVPGVAE
jgi:peptide synthetase PhsA